MMNAERYTVCSLLILLLLVGCTSESDQAQKYYEMGQYEAALNVANKALKRDRQNAEMAAIVWKIQILTQYCDDVRSVEMACSLIREKIAPFGDQILPSLRNALQEEKGCIKLFAVYTLGNMDSPEVTPLISDVAAGDFGVLEDGPHSGSVGIRRRIPSWWRPRSRKMEI
jgi:hypothetical protein